MGDRVYSSQANIPYSGRFGLAQAPLNQPTERAPTMTTTRASQCWVMKDVKQNMFEYFSNTNLKFVFHFRFVLC
jgi:hypothetical protein